MVVIIIIYMCVLVWYSHFMQVPTQPSALPLAFWLKSISRATQKALCYPLGFVVAAENALKLSGFSMLRMVDELSDRAENRVRKVYVLKSRVKSVYFGFLDTSVIV